MNEPAQRANDGKLPADEFRVIGIVGFAHGVSHFFHLLLPPLFPWLMADFGLSFIEVGATMTLFFTVSAIGQALAGFAVDRFGPVRMLCLGLTCFALAAAGLSYATSTSLVYAAAGMAGLGNAVFHPADYSVLNRRISPTRLGHAFAAHGVAGNLGWALAPVFMAAIAALHGWRIAALAAAGVAMAALCIVWINRQSLEGGNNELPVVSRDSVIFGFLSVPEVWLCFAFFFCVTTAFGGLQNFAVPILQGLYQMTLAGAAATLSVYLLAATAGVIAGGFLAPHARGDQVITGALGLAALLAAVLAAAAVPPEFVILLMAAMGFLAGTATPSRDLLVRQAATSRFGQGAYGRIYGLVYAGLDTGLALAPLLFGGLMDSRQYMAVLAGVATMQGLAILTAIRLGRRSAIQEHGLTAGRCAKS